MSGLPGLSLPGLTSSTPVSRPSAAAAAVLAPPHTESLAARSELRFEVASDKLYKVRLTAGTAELFGTELAHNVTYTFGGTKGAIFSWEGCTLELQGEAESEYTGSETEPMIEWLNLHGMLDTLREETGHTASGGPRVLILGTDSSGKTSLARCLTSWAIKAGHSPTIINLDPREGVLAPPSALTAATYTSQLDIESSLWGQSAISGPSAFPPRSPLIHHFPFSSPLDCLDLYKALATRLALDATSKLHDDPALKRAGIILDTPADLARPGDGYALIAHLISEFSINVVLTLGSERLYNDVSRRVVGASAAPSSSQRTGLAGGADEDETVHVLRISPSSGAVSRDDTWRRATRAAAVRSYFCGEPRLGLALNPHSVSVPFAELTVWVARDPAAQQGGVNANDFLPGGGDEDGQDDGYGPAAAAGSNGGRGATKGANVLEKVEVGQRLLNSVLAIKYVGGGAGWEAVRDAAVMGFVYVAEVDEGRKKVRFLTPHPGRWGDRVLVGGPWPEGVGDLVS